MVMEQHCLSGMSGVLGTVIIEFKPDQSSKQFCHLTRISTHYCS